MPTRSSSPSRCVVGEGVPRTDGRKSMKVQICLQTKTSCRVETGIMDDCVAAVTPVVAVYRRCKQRIKKYQSVGNRSEGCSTWKIQSCTESTSVAFATCVVQHLLRPWCRLDVVGGRLQNTVCMARCGLRAAFVWLCKSETIEDHVLYHATVVSRCTSKTMSLPAAVLSNVLWVTSL